MRCLAIAACVLLLAGCTQDPPPPKPLTTAEAEQRVASRNAMWWSLTASSDDPMPVVTPIEYVDPASGVDKGLECFTRATGIPSVTRSQGCYWRGADGERLTNAQNRTLFVCTLEYPYDLSVPSAAGMYSEEELDWAWKYQQERLVPCLRFPGYAVDNREGCYIVSARWWNPYNDVVPTPTAGEWERIDERCPPSPYGPTR